MKTILLILIFKIMPMVMAKAVDEIKSEEEAKPDISNSPTIQSENTNPHHLKIEPYTLPDDIFKLFEKKFYLKD